MKLTAYMTGTEKGFNPQEVRPCGLFKALWYLFTRKGTVKIVRLSRDVQEQGERLNRKVS